MLEPERRDSAPGNRLFRQDRGSFVDVTQQAGVADGGFGQGAYAADFDNDGDVDLYLANYGQGYARQIAASHGTPVSMVLKQLARLEEGGILVSRTLGRTRLYELNPRWFFHKELKALLEKALEALPAEEVKKH